MARQAKQKLHVPVPFTNEEKLNFSADLSKALSEKRANETKLKSVTAQIKSEIALNDETITMLSTKLETGYEYRFVECAISYDLKTGRKSYYREDTGEYVKSEEMLKDELREDLFSEHG